MSAALDHGTAVTVRQVLNHDIMNCTAEGVTGNHLYSGRALGISEPWDVIQLHPDLQSQWDAITAHYRRIGLSHTREVIWHVHREELGARIGFHPSVLFFGPDECRFWGDNAWMETVDYINSKNNFMALADRLGVDRDLHAFARTDSREPDPTGAAGWVCCRRRASCASGCSCSRTVSGRGSGCCRRASWRPWRRRQRRISTPGSGCTWARPTPSAAGR